jgi:hypothetical protein
MIQIKKFIDKVSNMEGRQSRDVILPIADARALRDEITKLIMDKVEDNGAQPKNDEVIQVVVNGGKFK